MTAPTSDADKRILAALELLVVRFVETLLSHSHIPPPIQLSPDGSRLRSLSTILRLVYAAALSHAHVRASTLINKRDLLYLCRPLFCRMDIVDRAIQTLELCVHVPRDDLAIVAAPKGMVAGPVSFIDETGCCVDAALFGADGCLIPARPSRMRGILARADAILVLEKETMFHALMHDEDAQPLLKDVVVVTGKGYPDFGTRDFLEAISAPSALSSTALPIMLVTDADPHGLAIAAVYQRGVSATRQVHWVGVRPSDLGTRIHVPRDALLRVTASDEGVLARVDSECDVLAHSGARQLAATLKFEVQVLLAAKTKFEAEALAAGHQPGRPSGLTAYIVRRVLEFAQELTAKSIRASQSVPDANAAAEMDALPQSINVTTGNASSMDPYEPPASM